VTLPDAPAATRPVLVVDNFDSFVYNLVQYLGQLGVPSCPRYCTRL
jgi:para-aminobenzoate synthetase component 2